MLAEVLLVTVRFDTGYIPDTYKLLTLMGHTGKLLKIAATIAGALVILGVYRYEKVTDLVKRHAYQPAWKFWLILHTVCFVVFIATTWAIFKFAGSRHFILNFAVLFWFACAGLTFITLLFSAFSRKFWLAFIHREKFTISAAVIIGFVAWFLGQELVTYGNLLNDWTFRAGYLVLQLFFDQPFIDVSQRLLGVPPFVVEIEPDCSGYEGIGLVVVFLGVYLWLYRNSLKFPQALLLFPIGILVIWTLNVLRIAALIAIGSEISPKIALGGFHSNAGWISFVATGLGLIWLYHRFALFSVPNDVSHPVETDKRNMDAATALLLPFVVLMATILLTQAVVSDFDWLYPIRVIVCAAVLWYFRGYYRTIFADLKWHAVLIGAFVFAFWLYLVPVSVEQDQIFETSLFSLSVELSGVWILFRILGAVITVPLIEELLFRGYLINLLGGQKTYHDFGRFTLFSFLFSSILFGVLHGQWVAGILAGMAFAGALYVRKQLVDAVVAHMTANALLAAYVISTGHWSLW
ncbi:MAG: exosortase E/protease, VPEID-CTERM system [Chromatiales bacterium]